MKFYESEYEEALIVPLQEGGRDYSRGGELHHHNEEILLTEDLSSFLWRQHTRLETDDVTNIIDHLHLADGQTHFDRLRSTHHLLVDGYRYTRQRDGVAFDISYIDFNEEGRNRFRAVNQFGDRCFG